MTTKGRDRLSTLVNSKILSEVRAIARKERQQLQTLVEEALIDLIAKRNQGRPRANVMAAYESSLGEFESLYKKLAE